jgi:hypothetical protein
MIEEYGGYVGEAAIICFYGCIPEFPERAEESQGKYE